MTWHETLTFLAPCLPQEMNEALSMLPENSLREIRIRCGQDVQLCCADGVHTVSCRIDRHQLARIAEALSGHSLYARSEETAQGYVTLRGGHRMGLCGQAHTKDGNLTLQHISSACIRIAVQRLGCAEKLLPYIHEGLLIIGPPGSGKTTLLRDLARLTSLSGRQTAVIDQRCELSACADGMPQLDIGSSDVLCGVPRPEAAAWLIRSMSPQVIVTDELAHDADAEALLDAHACGAQLIASVHGRSLNDAVRRSVVKALLTHRCFGCYAVLSGHEPGGVTALFDRSGSPLPLP